jgi:acyl carrier protein
MEREATVETQIVAAIAATCQIDPGEVRAELSVDDLGLGSMGLVAVISRLEAAFQLELASEEVISLLQTNLIGEFTSRASELVASKVASEPVPA